jgi:uncharacterized membrane protein
MHSLRASWWLYVGAAIFILTFLFNARQEAFGPANAGWSAAWPSLRVANVKPGSPMEKAGLRPGDLLEEANGLPLTGMPDWFVARAHFERGRPVEVQVRRGEQHLRLQFVIATANSSAWQRAHAGSVVAFYLARFMLLFLAIFVAFSRPGQASARLAAIMFAMGAVAEGYPSSGWAAALGHLPAPLALSIFLASACCLLSPMIWLLFCAEISRSRLLQSWRRSLVLIALAFFGMELTASAIAMIYRPSALLRPWPLLLSSAPIRLIQDIGGVSPLLYLNVWPSWPWLHAMLLELWLAISIACFMLGFLMLAAGYRRADNPQERRRMGALGFAFAFFGLLVVHNFFTRNWTLWFGTATPGFFSGASFVAEVVLFPIIPIVLSWCVLARPPEQTKAAVARM